MSVLVNTQLSPESEEIKNAPKRSGFKALMHKALIESPKLKRDILMLKRRLRAIGTTESAMKFLDAIEKFSDSSEKTKDISFLTFFQILKECIPLVEIESDVEELYIHNSHGQVLTHDPLNNKTYHICIRINNRVYYYNDDVKQVFTNLDNRCKEVSGFLIKDVLLQLKTIKTQLEKRNLEDADKLKK